MSLSLKECIERIENIAPPYLSESWDPSGLQIGDYKQRISRIALALDASSETVSEAIEKKADLLLVHHPLFFKPLKSLNLSGFQGRIIKLAIENNLSIYAAHTNLDKVRGGLNDALSEKIGLRNTRVLSAGAKLSEFMLSFELPLDLKDHLLSFFKESEIKLFLWPALDSNKLMAKCFLSLSDFKRLEKELLLSKLDFKLSPAGEKESLSGLGRIGELDSPMLLRDLAARLKRVLNLSYLRLVGDSDKEIRLLALCSGSGASLMGEAFKLGADAFLTGDIKYHEAMDALELGLPLIDAGHFGTENIVVEYFLEALGKVFEKDSKIELIPLSSAEDPFALF